VIRNFQFAFSKNEYLDIWVQVLEKAYAKAFGSYYNINGGFVVHAIRDLTGSPYERITDLDKQDASKLFERLRLYHKRNYLITLSTNADTYFSTKRDDG
jgi:calpain-15